MSEYVPEVCGKIQAEMRKVIVGQDEMMEQVLVGLLAGGHVLIEGVPGIAKTLMAKALARVIKAEFRRVQFTPDLMPSDILGTNVFDLASNTFIFKKGPVFTDILLADELNRTPPRTQSALLEAMEERTVTIDGIRHELSPLFMTIATQNPVEYEGVYPLPEAQLDRFMLKLLMRYPEREQEVEILRKYHGGFDAHKLEEAGLEAVADLTAIRECRRQVQGIVVTEQLLGYITDLVRQTRERQGLVLGGSPRASINVLLASKALAALRGKTYVTPEEIKAIAYPVLRHRLILKPEAELEGLTTDSLIERVCSSVEVPR